MGSIRGQQHFQLTLLSKVVICSLMSIHSWGVTAEQTQCRTTRPVPDHALTGHVISSLEGKRLESCVISCELTKNCFSINYYTALKKCELNKKTAEWYHSDLLPKSGAVYLNMVVRAYTPCVDRNPPCSGKCVAFTGSLVTRCVCELGNAACKNDSLHALGMESGAIPDASIKASSTKTGYDPWEGRLNGNSCWKPAQNSNSEYITVKFVAQVTVLAIATQGAPIESCWVKSYIVRYGVKLALSRDPKVYQANSDKTSIVTNKFSSPRSAEWMSIAPTSWSSCIALRLEVYGY